MKRLPRGEAAALTREATEEWFVIGPIGDRYAELGSDERLRYERALEIYEKVIPPACSKYDVRLVRADEISEPGEINEHTFIQIRDAGLVIADLTGANANVMYELGARHTSGKPTLQLGEVGKLPFDVTQIRTIQFQRSEQGLIDARKELERHLQGILEHPEAHLTLTRIWQEGQTLRLSNGRIQSDSIEASMPPLIEVSEPFDDLTLDASTILDEAKRSIGQVSARSSPSRLFAGIVKSSLAKDARKVAQWAAGTLRVGPEEALDKGIEVIRNLRREGFVTFLVPVESYWLTGTEYLEAARTASRARGVSITRVYILFDDTGFQSESLQECITLDRNAGITTLICKASRISDREAVRDFGIWDEELLCLVEVANVGADPVVGGCTFTCNPDQIERARRWRNNVLAASRQLEPCRQAAARTSHPLVSSAKIMAEMAQAGCKGSYLEGKECSWYHGSWEFMRILNLVSTPDWHEDFYSRSIADCLLNSSKYKRILICGTADYCMLAHVGRRLSPEEIDCWELVVMDACTTPLRMCEWYANNAGFRVRTVQGDARRMDFRDDWFDLIVGDAFLTRFPNAERTTVVREWERILTSGGRVITTIRLRKPQEEALIRASTEEVKAFGQRAKAAAHKEGLALPISSDKVVTMAEEYARRIVSHPMQEDEIRDLFASYHLTLEKGKTPGELKATDYARVVATRR